MAKPISRFIKAHPRLSRFLKKHLPAVSAFFSATIAPVFTQRARPRPQQPRMGL